MTEKFFRLTKALPVVKFGASGEGLFSKLPVGANVCPVGLSPIFGCMEIAYDDELYNIFEDDLRWHSVCPPSTEPAVPVRFEELGRVKARQPYS
jgi:hypothetical protein